MAISFAMTLAVGAALGFYLASITVGYWVPSINKVAK